MQIRNKIILIVFCFFNLSVFNLNLCAEEFNISASKITIDKKNNIITGIGSVEVSDNEGKIIKGDKVTYEKSREFLTVIGSVIIFDTEGNILKTDKLTYDKIENILLTHNNSELIVKEGYKLISDNILYNNTNKIISSDQNSTLTDSEGNIVILDMFQYHIERNLFSSVGKIKITDIKNNKYFFKELHVDTLKKEMIGSDVSVILDQKNFGVDEKSDPRLVANDIFMSKNKSNLSKGIFTICQKKGDKCPPWTLQAKRISHDKIKKTIYYDHATLKLYGMPIFYFPKFFHPDPTVKRQSGFLSPFFTDSSTVGTGFGLPYYWMISDDRDLTFTPKIYARENILLLNEYRQAFRNGFLTLDTSYTEGYKDTSTTKTSGSRNHIFGQVDFNFSENQSYKSNLSLKVQRASNDTYFRIHNINTALVNSENTNLTNQIAYNFDNNDMYLNISGTVYEDLRKDNNSRYEYIMPNIFYGKSFFTESFGTLDFKSNAVHRNYDVDRHTTFLTNDIIWSPSSTISKKGFVNTIEGFLKNTNYKATNTTDLKNQGTINELSSALSFKTSLPMKKEKTAYSNFFSPNFMVRYAPGHMRNLSGDDITLKYANLYSTNKTSVIEEGLSAVLGIDFKINKKNEDGTENEKLSLSIGQVYNFEENEKMPNKSSLGQKTSDVVGEINYNFSKIGEINYKYSLDHNLNDLNYNEVSTNLNFGKVKFNLDYLEERNHIGTEHYINSGISLNFNEYNKLSFATKKNYKTDSTEFYDIKYQYMIDCLTAGLVYRREFYEDNDVEKRDTLMFTITFIPFTGVKTPVLNP